MHVLKEQIQLLLPFPVRNNDVNHDLRSTLWRTVRSSFSKSIEGWIIFHQCLIILGSDRKISQQSGRLNVTVDVIGTSPLRSAGEDVTGDLFHRSEGGREPESRIVDETNDKCGEKEDPQRDFDGKPRN
jgi:hypothetical protein